MQGADLVVTTFYHLAEVRSIVRELAPDAPPEVLGIVIGPHVTTLVRLSQIPRGERIGIYYTTEEQAQGIRQSLADTGFDKVDVISGPDDPAIAGCAVVIVPSEAPELGERIRGVAPLVEFGNVLDAGSIRMVSDLVDEVRERKGQLVGNGSGPRRGLGRGADAVLDVGDDVRGPRARAEHLADADALQARRVVVGDRAADEEQDVLAVVLAQHPAEVDRVLHVRAGEAREPEHRGVLLDHRAQDRLRRLEDARVDDLHARVAQRAGHDLRAAVVAVEARLGDDDLDRECRVMGSFP